MASCITILLINIPYFISVASIVLVMWVLPDQISFHEIIFAWIPMLTSAINPLIVLTRTTDARIAVMGLFRVLSRRRQEKEQPRSNTQTTRAERSPLPPRAGQFTVIANKNALDV